MCQVTAKGKTGRFNSHVFSRILRIDVLRKFRIESGSAWEVAKCAELCIAHAFVNFGVRAKPNDCKFVGDYT